MVVMVNNLGEFMNIEISPKDYEQKMNWDDAIFYCQLLIIDGKDDWRLPTLDELYDIHKSVNDFFVDVHYWSSIPKFSDKAWLLNITTGNPGVYKKSGNIFVRAVRTI